MMRLRTRSSPFGVVFGFLILAQSVAAAEMRGVVLRADGTPAKGAAVVAAGLFVSPPTRVLGKTDDSGLFSLELPAVGSRWKIHARLGVEFGVVGNEHGIITVPEKKALAPVVIRLKPEGILRGRILQMEDKRPIAGAKLFISTGDVLTTDEKGEFEVVGFPRQPEQSLIPVATGRLRRYILFDTTLRQTAELEIHLEQAGRFKGQVLDESGKPIPGAHLRRPASGTAFTLNGWDQECDPDGHFTYDGVSLDRASSELEASAPGYSSQHHIFPAARLDQPPHEFTFRLKRTGPLAKGPQKGGDDTPVVSALPRRNLSGTVLDSSDQPLPDVLVRWGATQYESTRRETRTDSAGRFTLPDVPDRDGFLTAIGDSRYAPRFEPVATGETDIAFGLEPGRTARGVVKTRSGKRLSGVQIIPVIRSPDSSLLNPFWISERQVTTDDMGRFELSGLPQTEMKFDFLKEGFSDLRNHSLRLGDVENEVELVGIGGIRGRVMDPDGNPVRNFRIRLQIPRDPAPGLATGGFFAGFDWYGVSYTSDDGSFILGGVPAKGWLRVIAVAPGLGEAVLDPVQANSFEDWTDDQSLTLRLTPAFELQVKVVDDEGKPIPDASVAIAEFRPSTQNSFQWGVDDRLATRRRTNASGNAQFRGLASNEMTILTTRPGFARRRLFGSETPDAIAITLDKESVLTGVVRVRKKPLEAFYVNLQSQAADYISTSIEASPDGRFRVDQLPAGQYELSIHADRKRLYGETVTIEKGESKEIEIAIP